MTMPATNNPALVTTVNPPPPPPPPPPDDQRPDYIPPDAKPVERDARGAITVYEVPGGERYYTPASTMFDAGYRKQSEYITPQRVVTERGPGGEEKSVTFTGGGAVESGHPAPYETVKDFQNEKKHLDRQTYDKIAGLSAKEQFNILVDEGIIERGSIFVKQTSAKNFTWIPAAETRRVKEYTEKAQKAREVEAKGIRESEESARNQARIDKDAREAELENYQTELKRFENNNVKLGDGEYLARSDFDSLTDKEKAVALTKGYNALIESFSEKVSTVTEKVPIAKTVWRVMTPWAEENGETLLSFIKDTPSRILKPVQPSQEELKARYESESNSPLWYRFLFGPTVVKTRDGKYGEIIATTAPGIGPGGAANLPRRLEEQVGSLAKKVKLLTPEDLGISESQFARLVQERIANLGAKVTPKGTNWDELLKALQTGKTVRAFPPVSSGMAEIIRERINQFLEARKAASRAVQIELTSAVPTVTKENMARAMERLASMKPSEAIEISLKTNGILPAIAARPGDMVKLINNASPDLKNKALSKLSPELQEAVKEGNTTKAKTEALTQLKTQTQSKADTRAQTKTESKTKPATQTQTRSDTKSQTRTETSTRTDTQPQTQTKPAIQKQPATQIRPSTTTSPAPTPTPRISPKPSPKPSAKPPSPASPKPIPPLPRFTKNLSDKEARKLIKQRGGAVGYRKGELKGKDVWHVRVAPYGEEDKVVLIGKVPAGARRVTGTGSVAKSGFIVGKAPANILRDDTGAVDTAIVPAGRHGVDIVSVRDTTVTPSRPRIRSFRPVASRGGLRITPKRPRIVR